jgi:hypothetical protein
MAAAYTHRQALIAELPVEIRDEINLQLGDGVTYRKIADWLKEHGHGSVTVDMIGRWYRTEYQTLGTASDTPGSPRKRLGFSASSRRRPVGKIAALPWTVQEEVNRLLEDGARYRQVAEWLDRNGHPGIVARGVCNWYHSGYQNWLDQKRRLEEMEMHRELALKLTREPGDVSIEEAGNSMGASQLFEILVEYDVDALKQWVAEKPERYIKLLLELARISNCIIAQRIHKEREERRKRIADFEAGLLNPDATVSEETLRKAREMLDRL